MQFSHQQKIWIGTISVLSVGIALWLFNPFPLYFLNDDFIHIPLSKDGVLFQRNSMRPIGDLSIQMDYLLWGKNAAGYHFTNLLLHIINTFLVYQLSAKLIKKYTVVDGHKWQSIMCAVLFFTYAFHSETIFWILGRSGSLGTLFLIPALIFYLKRFEGIFYCILSVLCFIVGLFAYESVWIFPLLIIIVAYFDWRKRRTFLKWEVSFIAIVFFVFLSHLFLRYYLINEVAGNYEAAQFLSGDVIRLASNFVRLILRCFIPPIENTFLFGVGAIVFVLTIVAVLLVIKKKGYKANYTGLLAIFLLVSFLPYLSLGINTHEVEGERYLYMPSVFASLLAVSIIDKVVSNKNYQIISWAILIAYHLIFLNKSRESFVTASAITRTTIQQINLLDGKKNLFIDSLPKTVNGALVFRLGFDEGIDWLKSKGTVDSIFILSTKMQNKNWSGNFRIQESGQYPLKSINSILIRDTTHQQTYVGQQITSRLFNPPTDAYFLFRNDHLEIFK